MDKLRKLREEQFSEDYNINYLEPGSEILTMTLNKTDDQQMEDIFELINRNIIRILGNSKAAQSCNFAAKMKENDVNELSSNIQQLLDLHIQKIETSLSHQLRIEIWQKHNHFLLYWFNSMRQLSVSLENIFEKVKQGITSLHELCFCKSESRSASPTPAYINYWNDEDKNRVRSILKDHIFIFKQEIQSTSSNSYQTLEVIVSNLKKGVEGTKKM